MIVDIGVKRMERNALYKIELVLIISKTYRINSLYKKIVERNNLSISIKYVKIVRN